jgi:hypothetical protein
LAGVILEMQNWLEFVDMAQGKAYAHRRRHQESKWHFQGWAQSSLEQDSLLPPANGHKLAKGGQASK